MYCCLDPTVKNFRMELVTITNYEAWEYARLQHCTVASEIALFTRECTMIL